ncbi:hypothetical protein DMUE_1441 [Dictyocoela muelleri]|nr:hypothetical protein DMUE_1441 [Dictyocoela muelleri]
MSYEISDWDCGERTLNNIPLKTNISEGFNRFFNALFERSHPNLMKLIIIIRTQDHLQDQKINATLSFQSSRRPNLKTLRKLENLKTIINRYKEYYDLFFLKAITTVYGFNI